MSFHLDHVVIAVHDLQQAMTDYRELGFNPVYGGEHVGGKTHNALIVFEDGTYLELLAPTSPALLTNVDPNDQTNFMFLFAGGEGLVAFALGSDNLEADVAAMELRGVAIMLQPPNGRARPDGQQLAWRSAMLNDGSMLPFFIQDITPRTLRVPNDPTITTHANGVKMITELTISTSSLAESLPYYETLLGEEFNRSAHDGKVISEPCKLSLIEMDVATHTLSNRAQKTFAVQLSHLTLGTSAPVGKVAELDRRLTHNVDLALI
ncbi:MAG: VOC family protein [Anaerolineae bacterium]